MREFERSCICMGRLQLLDSDCLDTLKWTGAGVDECVGSGGWWSSGLPGVWDGEAFESEVVVVVVVVVVVGGGGGEVVVGGGDTGGGWVPSIVVVVVKGYVL